MSRQLVRLAPWSPTSHVRPTHLGSLVNSMRMMASRLFMGILEAGRDGRGDNVGSSVVRWTNAHPTSKKRPTWEPRNLHMYPRSTMPHAQGLMPACRPRDASLAHPSPQNPAASGGQRNGNLTGRQCAAKMPACQTDQRIFVNLHVGVPTLLAQGKSSFSSLPALSLLTWFSPHAYHHPKSLSPTIGIHTTQGVLEKKSLSCGCWCLGLTMGLAST